MKSKANYLSLTGYRLPTEAEMEYACRAKAFTSRYYGETDELLRKFAGYVDNFPIRSWPVGIWKPNDFGLFDMYGNISCWCQEKMTKYPQGQIGRAVEDREDKLDTNNLERRALRSGAFDDPITSMRSAFRFGLVPSNRVLYSGLRPVRTISVE